MDSALTTEFPLIKPIASPGPTERARRASTIEYFFSWEGRPRSESPGSAHKLFGGASASPVPDSARRASERPRDGRHHRREVDEEGAA